MSTMTDDLPNTDDTAGESPSPAVSCDLTTTFDQLAVSRREWIRGVLQPWCQHAPRRELLKAAQEWNDIAGRVDPQFTLWLWAWSRFPALYVDGLKGLEESFEVRVTLRSGECVDGYPDARESERGLLVLQGASTPVGPFSIDDITSVERLR
ncbi:MAG: hypothetical protein R3B90_15180 [Planctomycetaceae bacterium]